MSIDDLMQPGWEGAANNFCEKDMTYGMTELKVGAVGKPQIGVTAASPSPTTFGELMQALNIVPGQSQMLQVTSGQGSSQRCLGFEKPQINNRVLFLMLEALHDLSQMEIAKPVQPVHLYPCR